MTDMTAADIIASIAGDIDPTDHGDTNAPADSQDVERIDRAKVRRQSDQAETDAEFARLAALQGPRQYPDPTPNQIACLRRYLQAPHPYRYVVVNSPMVDRDLVSIGLLEYGIPTHYPMVIIPADRDASAGYLSGSADLPWSPRHRRCRRQTIRISQPSSGRWAITG